MGDSNDLILVWNLKEHGDPLVLRREATQDPPGWIYCTVFSPDGKSLTSSGFHPGVILWNLSNSKESSLIGPNYDWVQSIDISPDGSYMLTGSKNTSDRDPNTHVPRSHRISLWSLKTGTVLNEFAGSVAVFSPDGRRIAIADGQSVTFRPWK
jgi:WD40 repeat protein